jgi:hypothetical protein
MLTITSSLSASGSPGAGNSQVKSLQSLARTIGQLGGNFQQQTVSVSGYVKIIDHTAAPANGWGFVMIVNLAQSSSASALTVSTTSSGGMIQLMPNDPCLFRLNSETDVYIVGTGTVEFLVCEN